MTRALICHGRCNPTFAACEGLVKECRKGFVETGTVSVPPAHVLAALHQLTHTTHQPDGGVFYTCTICQTPRRYGREL